MSLDGSFSPASALRRLVTRCPSLQSHPHLVSLSQTANSHDPFLTWLQGEASAPDELSGPLAELLLHPSYTLPVVACFRPVLKGIVGKAVRLLESVKSFLEEERGGEGGDVPEEEFGVVEFYCRKGRGLRLHEVACLAFAKALELVPPLLRVILEYFDFSPPPFKRFLVNYSEMRNWKEDIYLFRSAIRVTFRFLLEEPKVFSKLWKWSYLLSLLQSSTNFGLPSSDEDILALDIKWCGIQISNTILRMSDRATTRFGLQDDEALSCFFRWEEFCQDTVFEKASWFAEDSELEPTKYFDEKSVSCPSIFVNTPTPSSVLRSQGSEMNPEFWMVRSCDAYSTNGCSFVLTSALRKCFEMVVMSVNQKWPILLYGPSGAGKTCLIQTLAKYCGSEVLFIHMDDLMDSKTLVGGYVCTEQPGNFRWQPGSLTQAVSKGLWLVFEDIDKAPSDVQSILLPLLEGSSSFATGHGEVVSVAEDFRLFSTISTLKHDLLNEGKITFGTLWRKIRIGNASRADLIEIINARYPSLKSLSEKLIDTLEKVNPTGRLQPGCVDLSSDRSKSSLRHLLKLCKRIVKLISRSDDGALSAVDCKTIYHEAVDIFASSFACLTDRQSLTKEIANIWIPHAEMKTRCMDNKPLIQELGSALQVGRVALQCFNKPNLCKSRPFTNLRSSLQVLERIACSVAHNEPVLLVGETGTGKTTLVQNLATRLGQHLTVLNLSQQSDAADLLGGFKPTDACSICNPFYIEFRKLFCKTFTEAGIVAQRNRLQRYERYVTEKKWKKLLYALERDTFEIKEFLIGKKEKEKNTEAISDSGCVKRKISSDHHKVKKVKRFPVEVHEGWRSLYMRIQSAHSRMSNSSGLAFSFVEGAFVDALRKGHWILLDEINLAPAETLQRITGVLDGENGTLCLAERGDVSYVERHCNFRIFACMNPATDAGKKDLPYSLKSRFTEFFVDDMLDDKDLSLFVRELIKDFCDREELVSKVVAFYKATKYGSEITLQDGANQKPQFSLRSLARALEYTKEAYQQFRNFEKAIYDGFCMFFLTLLDGPSREIMNNEILKHLLEGKKPPDVQFDYYLETASQVLEGASGRNSPMQDYVLTESVVGHLTNIARAVYIKRYPVLLQGPTSSGKTSLIKYLASCTGHEFIRINNHDHTDLQEYFGSYVTGSDGRLMFQEGPLVKAVRDGSWIVLDELNLAPSDVLEALNRLLDDNRELFVPELQETVRAHPGFMLFATQNPPTLYGGRKMLSRAFRNRFIEVHVDEIPETELATILEKRCKIPNSYAKKMVGVLKDLQLHRQNSKVFAGKHGFITPRDLFRWANHFREFGKSKEDLAMDGFFLLAERLREESEKNVVQKILEQRLGVKLRKGDLYPQLNSIGGDVVLTASMRRLYFLVKRCHRLREPVLLVGDTGGGKTTVCQLLGTDLKLQLHTLNCHQYTEASDFLGGFHPVRERSKLTEDYKLQIEKLKLTRVFQHFGKGYDILFNMEDTSATMDCLSEIIDGCKKSLPFFTDVSEGDLKEFEQMKQHIADLQNKLKMLFVWQDGPLVQAMKKGDLFLVDEISLADDSVLERLNSVLEPERTLSLAEKGGSSMEKIRAHPDFFILATMNPGGDYGKKELSPALRNRFTEIWVPSVFDRDELRSIGSVRFGDLQLTPYLDPMLNFWDWLNQMQVGRMLTVRDLLAWISFINATKHSLGSTYSFIHGAFLVLLDGLNLGTGISRSDGSKLRTDCLTYLLQQLKVTDSEFFKLEKYGWGTSVVCNATSCNDVPDHLFGINPFFISKGSLHCQQDGFEFFAPTTCRNALRLLRAMQLPKPVLLEGSPGVGKTSLVAALGKYSGHNVVRINLSEQTDMLDLLGSDLPTNSDNRFGFCWSDGILLQAIKDGSWVLLDELNLAPQSVLEGLNAILDHRAEVYIPELGLTFKCPPSFRVFACQNPSSQGGGRKGLPKSFLNRFTKVYVDELGTDDFLSICQSLCPTIHEDILKKLIIFNKRIYEETMVIHKYGEIGAPWEFNLRDIIRSCQIINDPEIIEGSLERKLCESFLNVIYVQRMRTAADRRAILKSYEEVFGVKPLLDPFPRMKISRNTLVVGTACVQRNSFQPTKILNSHLNLATGVANNLEAVLHCVKHQWMCILVGPPSSGKTSTIRLLSHITGNTLNELNLSSATDVSELLGGFEQFSTLNNFKMVVDKVECYVCEYCSLWLDPSWEHVVNDRKDLITRWLSFLESRNYNPAASCYEVSSPNSLELLEKVIKQLSDDIETYNLPITWSVEDLNKLSRTISDLKRSDKMQQETRFEWVSGELVRAIERGEWVVLDNANLCNPTVLDRINSLVESTGSITLNECGLIDGKPVVLHPHPNFRMFLTVDPKHGEVSRAMRNRGVEIFLMEPNFLEENEPDQNSRVNMIFDTRKFIISSGISDCQLIDTMSRAHVEAKEAGSHYGVVISQLELSRWIHLFQQLIVSGNQPIWSLRLSWEHAYLSSFGETSGKDIVIPHIKQLHLSHLGFTKPGAMNSASMSLPVGWPISLTIRHFLWFSQETSIRKNFTYLEFLGSLYTSYKSGAENNGYLSPNDIRRLNLSTTVQSLYHRHISIASYTKHAGRSFFDTEVEHNILHMAASWMVEQTTPNDFDLHMHWLELYSSRLRPYGNFFESFLSILRQVKGHPIWKFVDCGHEATNYNHIPHDGYHLPPLHLETSELVHGTRLCDNCRCSSTECWRLLLLTFQQWRAESVRKDLDSSILSLLTAIRDLEGDVLCIIVDSEELISVYSDLLDNHIIFWRSIITHQHQYASLAWHSLKKEASKFVQKFPGRLESLFDVSSRVNRLPSLNLNFSKPLLWLHGGHPMAPSSESVYNLMQQLLSFCGSTWPGTVKSLNQDSNVNDLLGFVLCTNPELKYDVVKDLVLADVAVESSPEVSDIVQLEKIYMALVEKVAQEKNNLQMIGLSMSESGSVPSSGSSNSVCCALNPELLSTRLGLAVWMETRFLFNFQSFLLDIENLKEFSRIILLSPKEINKLCFSLCIRLREALNYSLDLSSRLPTDFVPQHKMLCLLDAWEAAHSAHGKMVNIFHELWFKWHSSVWTYHLECLEEAIPSHGKELFLLLNPIRIATTEKLLHESSPIKEYDAYCLQLRIASKSILHSRISGGNLLSVLHSSARYLFEQILFVHKNSFDDETFRALESIFLFLRHNHLQKEKLDTIVTLIGRSTHKKLTSLVTSVIKPLLEVLYYECSYDHIFSLSFGWVYIGILRFRLLFSPEDPDPALKYVFKHSEVLKKISSHELEVEVRTQCELFGGGSSGKNTHGFITNSLEELHEKRKRLEKKIVFRGNIVGYDNLKLQCLDFENKLSSCVDFTKKLRNASLNSTNHESSGLFLIAKEACNWQEGASGFINYLSESYAAYVDIVQPLQVSVYEMKLGLALGLSGALEKEYKNKIEEKNDGVITSTIYSIMKFPRALPSEADFVRSDARCITLASHDVKVHAVNVNLVKKMVSVASKDNSGQEIKLAVQVSSTHLEASIHHIMLHNLASCFCSSQVIDNTSFLLLEEIFGFFTDLWMNMKDQVKAKEDVEAQSFKFRPRVVVVDDILKIGSISEENIASECEEAIMEQEFNDSKHESLEDEWNAIRYSILKDVVHIHNQAFGSSDLKQSCGVFKVAEAEKLQFFMSSYKLGIGIMQGMPGVLSSIIDENLMPEHLLYVCLESLHATNQQFCNMYKDPNAPVMSKMVKPLKGLQQRIEALEEWYDHPGCKKTMDVIEILLAMPMNAPLSKALLGLQYMINRAHELQESIAELKLNDVLQPIYSLVLSWQKIELESWPSLLDGVEKQHNENAAMLWFPLRSLLHRGTSKNDAQKGYDAATVATCAEDFIQTANFGDFVRRLQLLLAFHSELNMFICSNPSKSYHLADNLKIIYNIFGYYMQFLSVVQERVGTERGGIEKELREHLKLSKWEEHGYSDSSVLNFRRTRQKFLKLIKKYNDLLQQPVKVLLMQEKASKENLFSVWLEQKSDEGKEETQFLDIDPIINIDRFSWYYDWEKKADLTLRSFQHGFHGISEFLDAAESTSHGKNSPLGMLEFKKFQTGWEEGWMSLEKIRHNAAEFALIWKRGSKNLKKRRALSELLKNLEKCGLSRHRSASQVESTLNLPNSLFLQCSFDINHLLLIEGALRIQNPSHDKCASYWQKSNQYYFRNLAMKQQLWQISLNFHKDLTVEQVNRAASFFDHLILIQQEQRVVAYAFSEKLHKLKRQLGSLEHLSLVSTSFVEDVCLFVRGRGSLCHNQRAALICIWKQKNMFDGLLSLFEDVLLFLRCVENSHLSKCNAVETCSDLHSLIQKYFPLFGQSKERLDRCLMGVNGILTAPPGCITHFLVSNELKEAIIENFQLLTKFDEDIQALSASQISKRSVKAILLDRIKEFTQDMRIMEMLHAELQQSAQSSDLTVEDVSLGEISSIYGAAYSQAFGETRKLINDTLVRLCSACQNKNLLGECFGEDITSWKAKFESCTLNLQLDLIHDSLTNMFFAAGELLDNSGGQSNVVRSRVENHLRIIYLLLDLILTFGDGVLSELVTLCSTVGETSHVLAHIFASLFSKGFGDAEEQVDDSNSGKVQDATGTGMGEGEGLNDVSDQIDDEAQILGSADQQNDGVDDSANLHNKDDKGIEMDEDFGADTFSISEDSDNNEGEDEDDMNVESTMGGDGESSQAVQEKLWDKDEDGCCDPNEKYENGSSVEEKDSSSRELRAKNDEEAGMEGCDSDEEKNPLNGKDKDKGNLDDEPNAEDDIDCNSDDQVGKLNAFEEPTGVPINEEKDPGTMDIESEPDNDDEDRVQDDIEDRLPSDLTDEEADVDVNEMNEGSGKEDDGNSDVDPIDGVNSKNAEERNENRSGEKNTCNYDMESAGSKGSCMGQGLTEPDLNPSLASDSAEPSDVLLDDQSKLSSERRWPNSSESVSHSSGVPSENLANVEVALPHSTSDSHVGAGQSNRRSDDFLLQKIHANPYRSLGDALKEWKERVEISSDPHEHGVGPTDDMEDEDADDYQFVSETEKNTTQALGPATLEQMSNYIDQNKQESLEGSIKQKEDVQMLDIMKAEAENHCNTQYHGPMPSSKADKLFQENLMTGDAQMEESHDVLSNGQLEDWVSFRKDFQDEKVLDMEIDYVGPSKSPETHDTSNSIPEVAFVVWKKYELATTKLSHELAEQLRLVMEPTLANRLQGDYRTGKRINMRKVIPYIASHFRKDKIWLRRTKPNKRNYQVIVAVDDSRSMSENRCGSVALEALIAVCRAMSQLEIGQFAVAGFGRKGHVRLLHDFDQPFTGEAGVKLISSFSFNQDNTTADDPIIYLLPYLNSMLDSAVAKARLPSGSNPLQQLILIIADGRFHEKEKIRRYVRDALNRKRMIAFLLLDGGQESVMDLPEASFQGGKLCWTKYMNTFPFPYYVVLKNIESLPRTLADLLRQWFELMQTSVND